MKKKRRKFQKLRYTTLRPRLKNGRFRKFHKNERLRKRRAPPGTRKQFRPIFNLCLAADRQDFYDTVTADLRAQQRKRGELAQDIRIELEVHRSAITKTTRLSTRFIGKRRFASIRKFRRFLLLSGYEKDPLSAPDWTKSGMCQFEKSARLVLPSEKGRGKGRTLKKYRLES